VVAQYAVHGGEAETGAGANLLVVKNGSKMRVMVGRSMPQPLSAIFMQQ